MMREPSTKAVRSAAWTVGLFYALIVFEFFYMASPFAAYLYGAYLPGLEFLNGVPGLSWLTSFFLPHFVTTSSALVNSARVVGGVLTALGMLGFLVGAVQVYSRKLRKRGAAIGGIYRFLRHPQYASLILAGMGMLLVWPRFLMVAFFITMLFVYHALAWVEERECLRKFGQTYADYQQRTPRFMPLPIPLLGHLSALHPSGPARVAVGATLFVAALSLSFGIAFAMQAYSVRHLYAYYRDKTAYIALNAQDSGTLRRFADIGAADPRVRGRLRTLSEEGARLVAYVMPWEWAISEIPMNGVRGHHTPVDYDRRRFKIVYTRAVLRTDENVHGPDILWYTVRTVPVLEAWIDSEGQVAQVLDPPQRLFYGDVPVPVF
jgi:protein-S-isoprenylcysteine O-methyltransferase Ste14